MFNKSLILALALATPFFFIGCGGEDDDDHDDATPNAEVEAILALSGDSVAGADVFAATCAACHGSDGDSGFAADLSVGFPEHSDTQAVDVIIYGEGDMTAQSSLSDQEVADVLAYCRATFG